MTSHLRVLILTSSRRVQGEERALLALARGLVEEDADFTLLCLMDVRMVTVPLYEEARRMGLPVEIIYTHSSLDPRLPLRVARFIRDGSFTLLSPVGYKAEAVGLLVGRLLGLPVVTRAEGYAGRAPRSLRHTNLFRPAVAKRSHHVMANCKAVANTLKGRGVPPSRVTIVPNGVCVPDLDQQLREAPHEVYPWEDRSPLIVSAGPLEWEKGHACLLEATTRVKERFPNVALVLLGDGSLRSRLQHATTTLDLEENVFVAGVRPNPFPILKGCHLVAIPSLLDAMPMTLLETMALGKPVVASSVGCIPEVVSDGHTGLLVPPADPEALALSLLRILEDGALLWEVGQNARRFVSTMFNHRRTARRALRCYQVNLEPP